MRGNSAIATTSDEYVAPGTGTCLVPRPLTIGLVTATGTSTTVAVSGSEC